MKICKRNKKEWETRIHSQTLPFRLTTCRWTLSSTSLLCLLPLNQLVHSHSQFKLYHLSKILPQFKLSSAEWHQAEMHLKFSFKIKELLVLSLIRFNLLAQYSKVSIPWPILLLGVLQCNCFLAWLHHLLWVMSMCLIRERKMLSS